MPGLDQINEWWLYLSYCFPREYTLEVCQAHWTWVAFTAFVLAGSIFAFVFLGVLREYMKFRRNRLRLQASAVAAPAGEMIAAAATGEAPEGKGDRVTPRMTENGTPE